MRSPALSQFHSRAKERNEQRRVKFAYICCRDFLTTQFLFIDESAWARARLALCCPNVQKLRMVERVRLGGEHSRRVVARVTSESGERHRAHERRQLLQLRARAPGPAQQQRELGGEERASAREGETTKDEEGARPKLAGDSASGRIDGRGRRRRLLLLLAGREAARRAPACARAELLRRASVAAAASQQAAPAAVATRRGRASAVAAAAAAAAASRRDLCRSALVCAHPCGASPCLSSREVVVVIVVGALVTLQVFVVPLLALARHCKR